MSENEWPRVRVVNAPGYEDFEGDLIMEVPRVDDAMVSIIGIRGETKKDDHIAVIRSEYVEEIA